MSLEAIKEFYQFTFSDLSIQSQLTNTEGTENFVDMAVKLGRKYRYDFSKDEMYSTMSGLGETDAFNGVCFDNDWVKKIMEVGWVPMGYSR
ncbi:MAG: Nif11-like leader peptide family natural product precursor [Mariprofundaceae bacterium]|nr:Nif11-like leader peptide family natural product precursor [Mariprofundaceae bacterium]